MPGLGEPVVAMLEVYGSAHSSVPIICGDGPNSSSSFRRVVPCEMSGVLVLRVDANGCLPFGN